MKTNIGYKLAETKKIDVNVVSKGLCAITALLLCNTHLWHMDWVWLWDWSVNNSSLDNWIRLQVKKMDQKIARAARIVKQ